MSCDYKLRLYDGRTLPMTEADVRAMDDRWAADLLAAHEITVASLHLHAPFTGHTRLVWASILTTDAHLSVALATSIAPGDPDTNILHNTRPRPYVRKGAGSPPVPRLGLGWNKINDASYYVRKQATHKDWVVCEVHVRKDHIDAGGACSFTCCPLALAVKEQVIRDPLAHTPVVADTLRVAATNYPAGPALVVTAHTSAALGFMHRFDRDSEPDPPTLYYELPRAFVQPSCIDQSLVPQEGLCL